MSVVSSFASDIRLICDTLSFESWLILYLSAVILSIVLFARSASTAILTAPFKLSSGKCIVPTPLLRSDKVPELRVKDCDWLKTSSRPSWRVTSFKSTFALMTSLFRMTLPVLSPSSLSL